MRHFIIVTCAALMLGAGLMACSTDSGDRDSDRRADRDSRNQRYDSDRQNNNDRSDRNMDNDHYDHRQDVNTPSGDRDQQFRPGPENQRQD